MEKSIELAVEKYLADNHNSLDPIGKRQIESWSFEWAKGAPKTKPSSSFQENQSLSEKNHEHSGKLFWKSSNQENPFYMTLSSYCFWTETSLEWTCYARTDVANPPTEPKAKKIFKRLRDRLGKDDYISKLFTDHVRKKPNDADDESTSDGVILAQASIKTPESGLEERVFTDPDIAEGIRRVIWNSSIDPIDVLEFVIQYLPLLPGKRTYSEMIETSKLADRAVLRLLEDAMCDACDREGEEELVKELHIQKKRRDTEENG